LTHHLPCPSKLPWWKYRMPGRLAGFWRQGCRGSRKAKNSGNVHQPKVFRRSAIAVEGGQYPQRRCSSRMMVCSGSFVDIRLSLAYNR
jgi:hypothetical protein